MFRWLRSQLRERGYLLPPMPERDDSFVILVREHFDAVCDRHGLAFNAASVGLGTGSVRLHTPGDHRPPLVRETTVLYEADAEAFPVGSGHVRRIAMSCGGGEWTQSASGGRSLPATIGVSPPPIGRLRGVRLFE